MCYMKTCQFSYLGNDQVMSVASCEFSATHLILHLAMQYRVTSVPFSLDHQGFEHLLYI